MQITMPVVGAPNVTVTAVMTNDDVDNAQQRHMSSKKDAEPLTDSQVHKIGFNQARVRFAKDGAEGAHYGYVPSSK